MRPAVEVPITRPQAGHLVGTRMARFRGTLAHGGTVTDSDLHGYPALLVFFPMAFTEVCGDELGALNAARAELVGVRMLAISCDSMAALRTWQEQRDFGIDLVSDFWPHGAIADAFGAFDAATGRAVRASFLIDAAGTVRWSLLHPSGRARPVTAYRSAIDELRGAQEVAASRRGGRKLAARTGPPRRKRGS